MSRGGILTSAGVALAVMGGTRAVKSARVASDRQFGSTDKNVNKENQ
jgi:hypothetical protein